MVTEQDDELTLKLTWSQAKTLQVAIAAGKCGIKEGTETMKELEEIESKLEDFTQTSSLFFRL